MQIECASVSQIYHVTTLSLLSRSQQGLLQSLAFSIGEILKDCFDKYISTLFLQK